ncbi:MAG: cytochrome c biogenesis protein CcsA [Deltaproteobacteria bacterium]|nr:cytochrome c biogenesis protein CcsA [Deltaproteobacteria bacterium]
MTNLGQLLVWAAFIAVDLSFVCYVIHHVDANNQIIKKIARVTFLGFVAFITFAAIHLMNIILNHEFIFKYVAKYSSKDLPLQYLISSFWAGQEGSFLLWVLLSSWLGLILIYHAKDMEPQVMITYNLINLFLMLLLIKQSPFAMLPHSPPDGQGLNLLLQDPWMVIHPPVTFLGYASFAIPFAFAVASLWRRQYDQWVQSAQPWTIFAFVTLGAGIIIGGYWSYKVLGWGGYWAWDPVENASLLPWLMGMALMHGMIVQRTLGRLHKTNFLLAILSFCLIIYCTFLTRSGVLSDFSVHSFTDLGITGLMVWFMLIFLVGSVLLLIIRTKDIAASQKTKGTTTFSRELGLIAAIIVLGLLTLITGLGTSAPLITDLFGEPAKVAVEFYNQTNLFPAIMMLLLLCIVPYLHWGENQFLNISARKWIGPISGGIIAILVALSNGYSGMAVLLLVFLAGFSATLNLILVIQLIKKRVPLASGAFSHLGIGLMFLGIVASSVYDRSEKTFLTQGANQDVMGYGMKMLEPEYKETNVGLHLAIPIEVSKGSTLITARPNIRAEWTSDGQIMRLPQPHIQRGMVADLYISPLEFDPGDQEDHSGQHITLKRGERFSFLDYEFLFVNFDLTKMMGNQDGQGSRVGAEIEVSYQGGKPVKAKPFFSPGEEPNMDAKVKLPGHQDAFVTLISLDAGAKTIHLDYEGPLPRTSGKPTQETPTAVIETAVKPGMTILWLGVFFVLYGGCLGVLRRLSK